MADPKETAPDMGGTYAQEATGGSQVVIDPRSALVATDEELATLSSAEIQKASPFVP